MKSEQMQAIEKKIKKTAKRRHRLQLLSIMGVCVLSLTTWKMILPALALQDDSICGMEEHIHDSQCYRIVRQLDCDLEETSGHSHSGSCYSENEDGSEELTCGEEECAGHSHGSACYTEESILVCEMPEHRHSSGCYPDEAEGGQEKESNSEKVSDDEKTQADANHASGDSNNGSDNTDGDAGDNPGSDEGQLGGLEKAPGENAEMNEADSSHENSGGSDDPASEESTDTDSDTDRSGSGSGGIIQGITDFFSGLTSGFKEDQATEEDLSQCQPAGDPDADVESAADWEATLSGVKLTGVWSRDILAIAESQLDYHESKKNYVYNEEGDKKGYTRYGAWYGNAYGDWCAMFVSFCIHYADIDEKLMPLEASCRQWIDKLSDQPYEYYTSDPSYVPSPGDLIFFDWNGDGLSQHVGIVAEVKVSEGIFLEVKTIEGNSGNEVRYRTYDSDDKTIMGYASLPQNPQEPGMTTSRGKVFTYEDSNVAVTARAESEDALPEDAFLTVCQVTAEVEGYNYDAYMEALKRDSSIECQPEKTLLYDVAFLCQKKDENGNPIEGETIECQPGDGSVSLNFTFKKGQLSQLIEESSKVSVVHLPLASEIREAVDTTEQARAISPENVSVESLNADIISSEEANFQMDSFSLVAFVVNGQGQEETVTEVKPGRAYDYLDILGDAADYGIVAEIIKKMVHMDSGFAASKVETFNGNTTVGKYSAGSVEEKILVAETNCYLNVDGDKPVTILTTQKIVDEKRIRRDQNLGINGQFKIYSKDELNNMVNGMIGHCSEISRSMAREVSYSNVKYGTHWVQTGNTGYNIEGYYVDQNDKTLDLSAYGPGTYYINANGFLLNDSSGVQRDDLKIIKNSDQTIVFNIDKETVTLKRFSVENKDKNVSISSAEQGASVCAFASTIIFNMPNAKKVSVDSSICGVIIAPGADFSVGHTSSGWVVCKSFTNNGEWHFIYDGSKKTEVPEGYKLPATGGMGRLPFTGSGFVLIAVSICLLRRRQKHRMSGEDSS